MRGTVAKRLRRYVRTTYPFLAAKPFYEQHLRGHFIVSPKCQRGLYRHMKKQLKRGALA